MNKNPFAPEVPCHRVVKSDATLGEYAYGKVQKKKMLEEEGIVFHGEKIEAFQKRLHQFC